MRLRLCEGRLHIDLLLGSIEVISWVNLVVLGAGHSTWQQWLVKLLKLQMIGAFGLAVESTSGVDL